MANHMLLERRKEISDMKKLFAVLLAVLGFTALTPIPADAGVHFGFYFGPPAVYYGGPYYYRHHYWRHHW